jgi:uncharacterized small protein (DUF1192 family)
METALALGAQGVRAGLVAAIECNAGRARFVLCDSGCPVQVRRFLIGSSGESNATALTAQLAMELPRTFDWLREAGNTVPNTLVLGARVNIEDGGLDILCDGELQKVLRAPLALRVDEGQPVPSLGVATLLVSLCGGALLPSLLEPPSVQLPWGAPRFLVAATLLVVGAAASASAVVDGTAVFGISDRAAEVRAEIARLQAQAAAASAPMGDAAAPSDLPLEAALAMRRPLSLMLAQISNAADPQVHLEELKFASTDRLMVTGIVTGASRRDVLKSVSTFSKRLRDLPYVQPDGRDEIEEVAGRRHQIRFRLGLAWRKS